MRLRRRVGVFWRYGAILFIFCCVFFIFMVYINPVDIGKSSSNQFAELLFEKDGQMLTSSDPFEREFGGKDRLPPSVETMEENPKSHTGDSLLNYFLTMYIDGVEISWMSEVNTRDSLLEAMRDFLVMMLEADVDLQTSTDKATKIPTLINSESRPGDTTPDITMVDWMTKISKYSNKGMKLNFRDDETITVAVPLLNSLKDVLHAPIWIHADVVAGPNNEKVDVDINKLLKVLKRFPYPKINLSLGWSTNWDPEGNHQSYTWQHVINMAKLCAGIKHPVSFSIRAVFAVRSMRQIKWLLSLTNRFTVTVWINKYDIVPIPELVHFRQHMDPKKIYYNLPPNFIDSLKGISAKPSKINHGFTLAKWDRTAWQPILLQTESLAFMGSEQVVLDGQGTWLVSRLPHQPELQKTRTTVVSGKVQFLRPISLLTSETKFQVFIRSSGVNPPSESKVQGVRLSITDNGILTLSAENLVRASAFEMKSVAKLPKNDCYTFRIVDKGDGYPIYTEVRTSKCDEKDELSDLQSVELHLRVPYDNERQLFYISLTTTGGQDPVVIEDLTVT